MDDRSESFSDASEKAHKLAGELRVEIKAVAEKVDAMRKSGLPGDAGANATLTYRHLEDASMRLGKMMQALDGGVSVYDRNQVVGA